MSADLMSVEAARLAVPVLSALLTTGGLVWLAFEFAWPTARADRVIADWADAAGYELLDVSDGGPARERAAETQFGYWDRPGVVRRVTVRTPEAAVRDGWVFVAGGPVGAAADLAPDLPAEFVDVAWDD